MRQQEFRRRKRKPRKSARSEIVFGARDWTRTSSPAKALAPEASASTNFATRATESREIVNAHNLLGLCQTVIIPVFFFPLPWLPAVRGALCRTLQTAGESKDCLRDIRHSSQVQPESSPSTTKQRCELQSRPDSCSEGVRLPSSKSVRNQPNRRLRALFL